MNHKHFRPVFSPERPRRSIRRGADGRILLLGVPWRMALRMLCTWTTWSDRPDPDGQRNGYLRRILRRWRQRTIDGWRRPLFPDLM